jgi:hypothetical protein
MPGLEKVLCTKSLNIMLVFCGIANARSLGASMLCALNSGKEVCGKENRGLEDSAFNLWNAFNFWNVLSTDMVRRINICKSAVQTKPTLSVLLILHLKALHFPCPDFALGFRVRFLTLI